MWAFCLISTQPAWTRRTAIAERLPFKLGQQFETSASKGTTMNDAETWDETKSLADGRRSVASL